jgi:hypothetical protein
MLRARGYAFVFLDEALTRATRSWHLGLRVRPRGATRPRYSATLFCGTS